MYIIPAIDLIEGKCVRLSKGDFSTSKIYNENPLEVAKAFEAVGIQHLHLVDLDGARAGRVINYSILESIATHTSLQIDFGGGVKSEEDLRIVFESGATQVTGGTIAVKSPTTFESWLQKYGAEKIILGADFENDQVVINGWQESSHLELFEFIGAYRQKGIQFCIPTDVSRDGLLKGSAVSTYQKLITTYPDIHFIASGGITTLAEIEVLRDAQCYGAIIGKAIYEGRITLKDLTPFID
jgi:phosphoribosylformimino-5-aminoimidazole carboxamide ribotide isomerase